MNKIFISHNQDFSPAIAVKRLINMFGAQGILVEDEPGTESPAPKSSRLLNESQGFIGICTKDVIDQDKFGPKHNVVIEIQEWQKKSKDRNIIILKQEDCELPKLLGDPTYKSFKDANFLIVVVAAIQEFQEWGLIPSFNAHEEDESLSLDVVHEKFLEFLASCHNKKTSIEAAHGQFAQIREIDWNLMIDFLHLKIGLIDIDYGYGAPEDVRITYKGTEYLRKKRTQSTSLPR